MNRHIGSGKNLNHAKLPVPANRNDIRTRPDDADVVCDDQLLLQNNGPETFIRSLNVGNQRVSEANGVRPGKFLCPQQSFSKRQVTRSVKAIDDIA